MAAEGDYTYRIYRSSTGAYVIYTNSSNATRLMDTPTFEWFESHPKKLTAIIDNETTTDANNILNSSFAGWSTGTGAVELGDFVYFSRCSTGGSTEDNLFYGKIVDMPSKDGVVTIIAKDFLEYYENQYPAFTIFNSYVDYAVKDTTTSNGALRLDGITESDIVQPLAYVGYAHTEVAVQVDNGSAAAGGNEVMYNTVAAAGEKAIPVAMGFIAPGNAMLGAICNVLNTTAVSDTYTIKCSIQKAIFDETAGFDYPDGTEIVSDSTSHTHTAGQSYEFDFVSSNSPALLTKGQRYFFVFEVTNTPTHRLEMVINQESASAGVIKYHLYYVYLTSSWSGTAADVPDMDYVYTNYEEYEYGDYYVDETNDKIYIMSDTVDTRVSGWNFSSYYYGLVSYYYGLVTHETICYRLIRYNTLGLVDDTDSDQDREFPTFSTQGKSLADCLRLVCDVYETSGSWTGHQHIVSAGIPSVPYSLLPHIKTGRKYNSTDTSARTFSTTSSTDDHNRIMSTNLTRRGSRIPYSVTVVGKGANGNPIISTMHSIAESDTTGDLLEGFVKNVNVYDENITSLDEASKRCITELDKYDDDTWSGDFTVSGVFYTLMQINEVAEEYGSGRSITLTYPKLGISAVKYHVTGIIVDATTTRVFISNPDIIHDNNIKQGIDLTKTNNAFISPVGLTNNKYVHVYSGNAVTTSELWMELQTSAGTTITGGRRKLCTKTTDTGRNLNRYHAEFETWDGYTASGTPVGLIRLYTAQTGGTLTDTYDLITTRELGFDKWKSMRVIIDFTTKIS